MTMKAAGTISFIPTGMETGAITAASIAERFLNSEVWIPARVDMGDDRKWYLVGLPGLKLDGLEVKAE